MGQGVHCNCSYRALRSPSHETRRSRLLFSFCRFLWNTSDKLVVVQTQHLPSLVCMCPMSMNWHEGYELCGVWRMLTLLALPRTCPMQPSSLVWWWAGGMLTFFAAHTCWMLLICSRVFVGWGDVNVLSACTHIDAPCYATDGSSLMKWRGLQPLCSNWVKLKNRIAHDNATIHAYGERRVLDPIVNVNPWSFTVSKTRPY